MPDEKTERCEQILESLAMIEIYLKPITLADDFLKPKTGQLHLDAVTLRLQVIGENAKQIENIHPQFFWHELQYDIGYLIRFRDFVSHHYERLDYEIVYDLCKHRLPKLEAAVHAYLMKNG